MQTVRQLAEHYEVTEYGRLTYTAHSGYDFPLYAVTTRNWQVDKPIVLVTGGVHGYETSGVHGALRFLQEVGPSYEAHFNLLVAPCLSPWAYETINRWTPAAIDPNRSFVTPAPVAETGSIMAFMARFTQPIAMHIDLHETTDTDNSEFRPALAARDGEFNDNWNIPDGFYTVGDANRPQTDFQRAVLSAVRQVTHLAESDEEGQLIGIPAIEQGLIQIAARDYGLCMGFTDATYVTTTEVYPDSVRTDPEECIQAQVAAIKGGLDYILAQSPSS